MARKNRISVYDGIYHITTRIANRAMLLKPEEIKDRILDWVLSVAAFSGIEIFAFSIMDNHLHIFLHVPPVPERLWLDPNREPDAYAFGMRPPERNVALWSDTRPSASSAHSVAGYESPEGDCPRAADTGTSGATFSGDCPRSASSGLQPDTRPELGFMLSDDEMLERLSSLYGATAADRKGEAWATLRGRGLGHLVDAEKAAYCRRMYNLSQYVKTLKERVSMWYNREYGHAGCLWEGRFHSGIVERDTAVLLTIAAYVGYNPVKAGIAPTPAAWRWSSYTLAVSCEDERGCVCREMYARMLGRPWEEVRALLESAFADRLPEGVRPEDLEALCDNYGEDRAADGADGEGGGSVAEDRREKTVCRATQAIHAPIWFFSHGAYIGRGMEFYQSVVSLLPVGFPHAGVKSVKRCRAFAWVLPPSRCVA